MATQPTLYLTFEEYVALERQLGTKLEYCQGQVYGMSGASAAHIVIQSNLVRHLGNRLDGTPCQALVSELRVHIWASDLYTYPDVSIVCGPLTLDKNQSASNPKVVFEVLSPSTRHYDLVAKFEHYRNIPSLEEYVLVEQVSYSINRHRRLPDGQWELTRYKGEDALLELASVNITIPLKQIYANVPFDLAERDTEQP
ncbi:MAG: Uma2 family endonuclease [Bryobacteraceae bacterium]